jgi:predicted metal-binding protein
MNLKSAEASVSEALILICEKCGKKLSKDSDDSPARTIQHALKEAIKADGGKGKLKAVVTSCLDLCPKEEIAVAISRTHSADQFFTLSGKLDEQEAASEILKRVNKK